MSDDALDAAFAELLARREVAAASADLLPVDFVPTVRGGEYTLRKTGAICDYDGARARGNKRIEVCVMYGLERQFTLRTGRWGDADITRLANEWCMRMQYMYNEFRYSPARPFLFLPKSSVDTLRGLSSGSGQIAFRLAARLASKLRGFGVARPQSIHFMQVDLLHPLPQRR